MQEIDESLSKLSSKDLTRKSGGVIVNGSDLILAVKRAGGYKQVTDDLILAVKRAGGYKQVTDDRERGCCTAIQETMQMKGKRNSGGPLLRLWFRELEALENFRK
ncbi:hypothetical protein QAD02_023453 [Eretmocerus hayati]|uniref:Uncharacterized protein n=1 Tax=Eretmocerus hayati TaxID=131215 RepID=A0ACC2PWK3_9HYME|nr:hypothetical protein QAD02_023453 [Eretmocerus hayati]